MLKDTLKNILRAALILLGVFILLWVIDTKHQNKEYEKANRNLEKKLKEKEVYYAERDREIEDAFAVIDSIVLYQDSQLAEYKRITREQDEIISRYKKHSDVSIPPMERDSDISELVHQLPKLRQRVSELLQPDAIGE